MKKIILDNSIEELQQVAKELGLPSFRVGQIHKELNLYKDFSSMTAISKELRAELANRYIARPVEIIETLVSVDGTEKYLFKMTDGNIVEGVLMKYKYGNTQCISTQVGCRMNCAFCASGLHGLVRNLTSGEILSQVLAVNTMQGGGLGDKRKITNLVLMGSGEPLDNYTETVKFLRSVTDKDGLNISPRNISLSTCGLVDKMYAFANENIPLNLTVSLHSPFDDERKEIMPVAKKYTVKEIISACENYFAKTSRRYIFEYTLIQGKNDGKRHLEELKKLLKGKPCHINIIRLNEVKERSLKAVSDKNAYAFAEELTKNGLSATVRRQIGVDIDGACGQLRQKYIEEGKPI